MIVLFAERQQLVEQRLAVAHRAGGPPGDEFQGRRLDVDAFGLGDLRAAASTIVCVSIVAKSNRWQRERMVSGTFFGSVVQKMNLTFGGGSSSVFKQRVERLAA